MTITVRFFAAASAAAGTEEAQYPASTLQEFIDTALDKYGEPMAKLIPSCSFLLDGVAMNDRSAALPAGSTLDVLPPFAGG